MICIWLWVYVHSSLNITNSLTIFGNLCSTKYYGKFNFNKNRDLLCLKWPHVCWSVAPTNSKGEMSSSYNSTINRLVSRGRVWSMVKDKEVIPAVLCKDDIHTDSLPKISNYSLLLFICPWYAVTVVNWHIFFEGVGGWGWGGQHNGHLQD